MMAKGRCSITCISLFVILLLMGPAAAHGDGGQGNVRPVIVRIVVDGPISPVSADYIQSQIQEAENEGDELFVLQLDTPGGLMSSTRDIVKAILGSKIPVAVYVAPPGARAASAGVFITMSANIAAMAPGTHIGAAHPVNIGGGNPLSPGKGNGKDEGGRNKGEGVKQDAGRSTQDAGKNTKPEPVTPASGEADVMGQKILNDTVAFIRSIAERRGRNADWAEKAVRESVSITEKEALKLNVIDLVAENMDDLLAAVDGRTVDVAGHKVVLSVKGGEVIDRPMNWRQKFLMSLSDPNVAYIFMMLGIFGLFFELANPGVILPGALGGIFLVLAFFSFQVLSINYAGVLLIILGFVLFILEVKVVSYGMLSVGGVASLFLGSMMLFKTGDPYLKLSMSLVLAFTLTTALFVVVGLTLVIRTHRKKPVTGTEGMIGEKGMASTDVHLTGKVRVHGEIWSASSDEPLKAGDPIVVLGVDGMALKVRAERDQEL